MRSILIVGDYSTFVHEIISKFYKENWRIYILTNDNKSTKPAQVFEQYTFEYDSSSIEDVLRGCNPDTILFTGAYDPLYKWNDENIKEESLKYIAGLSNILMCAKKIGIRHFIYISSDDVHEGEYAIDINEDMATSPDSLKGMTISQGESLAIHFDSISKGEVTVVRIAGMYGIPSDRESSRDICSKLCLDGLTTGRLKVNVKKVFSVIYVKDAVEGLYLLVKASERNSRIYHISSVEEVTEYSVALLIQKECFHRVDIVDQTIGLKHRIILSNERFNKEFDFEIRNNHSEIIPKIISYMESHKNIFFHKHKRHGSENYIHRIVRLFKGILPFVESIIFFLIFFILDSLVAENPYFKDIDFFLLYVLLFALVHGRQFAILAFFLSVVGYFVRHVHSVTAFSLLIDSSTYIWIAQIFLVGLTVGHLKDKFSKMEADKDDEIVFLTEQLKNITEINSSNMKIKEYYGNILVDSKESIGQIYEITSKLDNAAVGEVLFAAQGTFSSIMHTEDVAIYLSSGSSYCRLVSASSEKARSFGKSINMENYKSIFNVLENKQVYINRTLDSSLPMMGNAIFDEEDNMRILIFLWDIPYDRMTLYQSNVLTVISALVYSAFVRDSNYLDALAYSRYVPGTTILEESAFREMLNVFKNAEEKGYAELHVFYIQRQSISLRELNDKLKLLLRDTDYMGMVSDGSIAILLTNTNASEAIYVRKRLKENNIITHLEGEP